MKLYFAPGVCSLSPHITIHELELPVELVKVNIQDHTLEDGSDYLAINPRGYVPLLELDNGERMTEGPAIVQYLADLRPEAGIAPQNGTLPRYRLQEALGFINSELHKGMAPLFDPSTPGEMKVAIRTKVGKRLDWLSEQLEGRQYLLGERYSVADPYLFTVLGWTVFIGIDLARWPTLNTYHARIAERAAVRAAMRAEGLLK
jgi:glutathione S-transferase